MTGFDRLVYVRFETLVHVQKDNFATRCHDIAHDAIAQIQRVEHKFTAERRYLGRFFALAHNQPQFFLAVDQLSFRNWLNAENPPQHPIARGI